ncbi:MmgE/PrpD family protein [Chloroflexota bacterium]
MAKVVEINTAGRATDDAAFALAKCYAGLKYDDIPPEIVDVAKNSILDTLGVIVGGSGVTPGIKELVGLITEAGGKEESGILGFGNRVPAWEAAFCNGAMAHCLDYDDMSDRCEAHPSTSVVPAVMALAERKGNVAGKDLISAVVLGDDLVCRLGLSTPNDHTWHRTPLFGYLAAAMSCSKLLGFDEKQYVGALGTAFTQTATTMEVGFSMGSDLRGMYAGFSARGGVMAALMSSIGIAGPAQSLEGKAGFFNVYFGGNYDRKTLLDGLGKKFETYDIAFKVWPACRGTHAYIEAALLLQNEHNLRPENIAEVLAHVKDFGESLFTPLEGRRRPTSVLDAKFSIPFSLAVALTKNRVAIQDLTPEGLKDTAVLAMAQKINYQRDPKIVAMKGFPGQVDIKTKQGETFSKLIEFPRGNPENPTAKEDIEAKFKDCVSFSAKAVPRDNVEQVIEMINHLEEVTDSAEIMRLLC